jgi:hypothetical protein
MAVGDAVARLQIARHGDPDVAGIDGSVSVETPHPRYGPARRER